MILGGIAELLSSRQSLESIARPLTAVEADGTEPQRNCVTAAATP